MIAVVLPTIDEAGTVVRLIEDLAPTGAHVIVVDDGSRDGTDALAEGAGARVIRRGRRMGLRSAVAEGAAAAIAGGDDLVVQMDADLSHDPADVPRLVEAARNADLVIGSRLVAGAGEPGRDASRRLLTHAGNAWTRFWLAASGPGVHYARDLTSGFRCWRADLLREVDLGSLRCEGYAFQIEAAVRAARLGARVVEVPIAFHERAAGRSKIDARIVLEGLVAVPRIAFSGGRR